MTVNILNKKSQFTTYYSMFTVHYSLLTVYCSLFTVYRSLVINPILCKKL